MAIDRQGGQRIGYNDDSRTNRKGRQQVDTIEQQLAEPVNSNLDKLGMRKLDNAPAPIRALYRKSVCSIQNSQQIV